MYFITHFVIFIFYYNVYYAFWSEFVSLLAVPKQININDMKPLNGFPRSVGIYFIIYYMYCHIFIIDNN